MGLLARLTQRIVGDLVLGFSSLLMGFEARPEIDKKCPCTNLQSFTGSLWVVRIFIRLYMRCIWFGVEKPLKYIHQKPSRNCFGVLHYGERSINKNSPRGEKPNERGGEMNLRLFGANSQSLGVRGLGLVLNPKLVLNPNSTGLHVTHLVWSTNP